MNLRAADYQASGWDAQQWGQVGAGTVSYYFNGVGYYSGNSFTRHHPRHPNHAAKHVPYSGQCRGLDLSVLPTRILMVVPWGPTEEIRICSQQGNVLNVCYDGRGQSAQSWSTGSIVGQSKVTGAGTSFVTDPVAPVCPAGAPGPPGPAAYTAGTVTLAAGSNAVTGLNTAWQVRSTEITSG